jgi:GntR family transcriptional regulator
MAWKLDSERPIYTQIIERVVAGIISGTYQPGEKLPSVRELAAEAAVNPNTMQKALSELERTGLVKSQRTSGRFITEDTGLINSKKSELAKKEIKVFLEKMESMGLGPEEIENYIHEYIKEEEA